MPTSCRPLFTTAGLFVVLGAALSACSTTGSGGPVDMLAAAQQQLPSADADCAQKYHDGVFRTHVETATCINDAEQRLTGALFPYPDLMAEWQAKRVALASEEDDRQITQAQSNLEYSEVFAQISAQARQRDLEQQSANTERAQALATVLANNRPYMLPPPPHIDAPRIVNCTTSPLGTSLYTTCQ